MEEDMFKFKVGGRNSGQTFTNAMTLLKYIDELQPNKMYGIMKAGKSITLLTKNEVISKVKELRRFNINMDIENMNIEKATERCNQLIKQEHANWIGISNQVAIIRVLNELEKKDKRLNRQFKLLQKKDKDIEELKTLFYSDRLTQYGKRKLIRYYEQRIKQLEEENVELRIENSAMNTVLEDLKARLL